MRYLLWALLAVGCAEARTSSGPPVLPNDGGPSETDAGSSGADAGATMDAGAFCGDQTCAPTEDCTTCAVDCGPCECEFGFTRDGAECVPDAPEPFRSRTVDDVCGRWRADHVTNVGEEWTPTPLSEDPCDPGTMSQASHDNAVLRTNLYRWLVGLDPVTELEDLRDQQQACAVVMNAIGSLTHDPPESAMCYSPEGASGAGSSNIAFAGGGLARSVDLYIGDRNVASLGHRRWAFNPAMGRTTFGYKPPFSCMYAFDMSGSGRGDFVAYPPPGRVPEQAASGEWSFGSQTFGVTRDTTVELDTGDGFEAVTSEVLVDNFGAGPVVKWSADALWAAGAVVRVAIRGTRGGDFVYTVAFVDCP